MVLGKLMSALKHPASYLSLGLLLLAVDALWSGAPSSLKMIGWVGVGVGAGAALLGKR